MANGFDPNQSSVEFGMGLLEKTQKDIRKRQKEAQRLNRNIALGKLAHSALSGVVTNKWNDFERQEKFKKIQLNNIIDTNKEVFDIQTKIDTEFKGNAADYFEEEAYKYIVSEQDQLYPYKELSGNGIAYARQQATNIGKQRAKEWEEVLEHAKKIPTSVEGLDADWDYYRQSQVPTSVGNWIVRGIRGLFDGKSKEEFENDQQAYRENVMSNEGLFKDYVQFKDVYNDFLRTNPALADEFMGNLIKDYNEAHAEDAFLRDKLVSSELKRDPVTNPDGSSQTVYSLLLTKKDEDGNLYLEEGSRKTVDTKPAAGFKPTSAKSDDLERAESYVNSYRKGNPEFQKFYDNYFTQETQIDIGTERIFHDQVHIAQQYINRYLDNEPMSYELAIQYLYNQYASKKPEDRSRVVNSRVTLYDLDPYINPSQDFEVFLNMVPDFVTDGTNKQRIYIETRAKINTMVHDNDQPFSPEEKYEALKALQQQLYTPKELEDFFDSDEDIKKFYGFPKDSPESTSEPTPEPVPTPAPSPVATSTMGPSGMVESRNLLSDVGQFISDVQRDRDVEILNRYVNEGYSNTVVLKRILRKYGLDEDASKDEVSEFLQSLES